MNLQKEKIYHGLQPLYTVCSSVVDSDPVGSKTFSRIRIRSDPKLLVGSGSGYGSGKNHSGSQQLTRSEINLKYNYSEKLAKFDNFSTKMLNLTI
jgi:hypothetical protein